jgi:tripartite ATP-independent transporter DctP family solute receptor
MFENVQEGSLAIMTSSPAPQSNFVKAAIIFDLPFAFPTPDDTEKAFTNENFLKVLGEHYVKAGFTVLGLSNLGFRLTTSNFEFHTVKELKGFSVRTMENPYHMAMWKCLGANPTPIAFNELYTALQQHTVDGQENPMELIYGQKFYEQQKVVTKTNHLPQSLVWVINRDFYDKLPADQKKVIADGGKEAVKAAANFAFSNTEKFEKLVKDVGTKIVDLNPKELSFFADASQPVWEMVRKDCPQDVYDAYIKALPKR